MPILKLFFKAGKNAWTHYLKWCNHTVCPAESDLLINVKSEVFTVQCTDVWNEVCHPASIGATCI